MSYIGKVYRKQGGDELVVASGGKITNAGTQAAAIADLNLVYSSNDPSITPDGSVTIANGSTPSDAEFLEFLEELQAKQNAILAALRGVGIIAGA